VPVDANAEVTLVDRQRAIPCLPEITSGKRVSRLRRCVRQQPPNRAKIPGGTTLNHMRNHTVALALFLVSGPAFAEPEIVPLKITVECVANPQCVFDGGNMRLEFTVTNIQAEPISMPVDYIARRGPFIKLTDRKTRRSINVKTGIPNHALRSTMTILQPGESFKFHWTISPYEFEELPSRPIDASAAVTLIDLQGEGLAGPLRKYLGRTTFQITQ
jgi:hypothetical protein